MFKKLKYLSVLSLPICVWISFHSSGILTFLPALYLFIAIPFFELILKVDKSNLSEQEKILAANDSLPNVTSTIWLLGVFHVQHSRDAINKRFNRTNFIHGAYVWGVRN